MYPVSDSSQCPCGSGLAYDRCCRLCHLDHGAAVSAESLMRSRYSAFVLKLEDYLLQTWHASTRPLLLDLSSDDTEWIKLDVLNSRQGRRGDQHGKIEFKAYYRHANRSACLHEISRFCREDGKWFYLDGKIKST